MARRAQAAKSDRTARAARQLIDAETVERRVHSIQYQMRIAKFPHHKDFGSSLGRIAFAASLFNAVDLINTLIKEQADGKAGKIIRQLSALDCIIIDGLGYIGLRPFTPQTIHRMVCRRASRRPFPKPGPKSGGALLFHLSSQAL